ncbi:DUF4105 domain-containing protein [Croceitalea sp. P059]|uniref:lipoprotein N-acyltransferase Lnb domain-containing protein n=1 Tax=Croceitalea sp. P059 TaxID=3075601 RepID=UPI002886309F|nr:DUF4105 domain-containing protein [Croceitalea sp. P059]MDT0540791.1 DUF4105 domain-containing protein [Croceitalea sp. P059]
MLHAKIPVLSKKAQISVLTCSAGDQLFSSFGHTAFRVQDPELGIDVVYNYGTFDFNKPNFYLNFAKGKLIYSLSRKSFEAFLYDYQLEKRWIKEQLLDLNQEQANHLLKFFEENYKPENRDYPYDPLFNNCSTITGDILEEQIGNAIVFNGSHLKELMTFRQLVHQHIKTNEWGTFGIDLAFGGITDKQATVRQHMFLPYYAMYQLNNTTYNGKPLLSRERTISDYPEKSDQSTFLTSPLFWFMFVLCFVIAITYLDKKHDGQNKWLDFTLFFVSGLAGLILMLLWFATDHVVTQLNFNFLWLLPTNLVVAFYIVSKKKPTWLTKYLWLALGLMVVILLIWIFKIQILSPLNIPLLLILAIRYLFLLKKI